MPALGLAVEPPPPLRSAEPQLSVSEQDELTTQLQGLHQLHIQLETAIAFLEGREPHGVPLFEGELQDLFSNIQFSTSAATETTNTTAGGASPPSPQSAAEAQQQFTNLLSQIIEIQRDFGKLKLQQRQQREKKEDSASSSSLDELADEEGGKELALQDDKTDPFAASLSSSSPSSSSPSQNEDSNSVTSLEEEESVYQEQPSKRHPGELKLLMYHKSSEIEGESSDITSSTSRSGREEFAATEATPNEEDAYTKGEESSPPPTSATLRLQLLQARRQIESRGREIARLQEVVQNLEAKVVSAAAPKAVMAQAAEMQKKYNKLKIQLRNAELDASEANSQISTLRKAAKEREKEFADMKKPSEVAVEQWQEGKKLQKRIEFLQNKLQEKSKETETARKAQEMLQSQVNRLNNELAQSQANGRNLLSKLEKQELKYNGGPGGKKNVPGTVVQKIMEEMEALQQRYDALERHLAATQGGKHQQTSIFNCATGADSTSPAADFYSSFSAPVSLDVKNGNKKSSYCPSLYTESSNTLQISSVVERGSSSAGSVARDLKILDLELQRDQATARAERLQQRLQFMLEGLGQTSNCEHNKSQASPYLAKQDRRQSSSNIIATKKKGSSLSGGSDREQQLLDTISLLKSALEKTRKGLENGVSSAKYMQAVERAKLAAERVKELEAAMNDAEMDHERVRIAQREAADAQVMISALRGQLRDAKRRGKENAAARDEIINAQIAELERALRERDAQLAALKHSACDEALALVAEGLTPKIVVNELVSARAELASALEREEVLKRELAPFDAVFFAELHQLKREHEELRMMCASYQNRTK
ncbi:hypothetical protein Ndes2437A_g07447 [Nannochloris sp. 'desiccata']